MKASPRLILGAFLIAAPVALFICTFFGAAGHGTYIPAMLLFPYTMISTYVYDEMTGPFIVWAMLQFPVYGIVLAFAQYKNEERLIGRILLAIHLLAVLASFVFTSPNFR